MSKVSVDDAKRLLRANLPDFLREHGVKEGKKNFFRSIYGETEDRNPSLHIFITDDGDVMYHDFSTGRSGDIFTANHILNGAPLFGQEFYTDNLMPLAQKYGIDVTVKNLTESEEKISKIKGLYRLIKDISVGNLMVAIHNNTLDNSVKKYLEDRDLLNPKSIRTFSLGWIPNWDDFKEEILNYGVNEDFLLSSGIKKFIFNNTNLLFNVIDEKGRVKGFIARNCYFSEETKNTGASKYYNIENNIWFQKSSMLYNVNNAIKKKREGYLGPLYVVEGPTDAIALHRIGLKAIAVGSLNFNKDHINKLQSIDESDVILVLDGDEAGIKATRKIIFEVLDGVRAFKTRVVELPGKNDPYEFIAKYGKSKFLELEHKSTFTYKLEDVKSTSSLRGHDLAKEVIPFIVNEPSAIERDSLSKILAKESELPISVIREEVNRLYTIRQGKIEIEREAIVDNLVKELKRSPKDAVIVLDSGLRKIMELEESVNQNTLSIEYQLEEILKIEERGEYNMDANSVKISRMPKLERSIDGDLMGSFMVLGGQPNAGKSTMVYNIIRNVLEYGHVKDLGWENVGGNPNNVSIILHTVDDSIEQVVPKIATLIANDYLDNDRITIKEVMNISRITDNREEKILARKRAYEQVRDWMRDGRLFIKDASSGARLTDGLRYIREYKTRYPERLILYIVDNMYNLNDFSEVDERAKISKIGNALAVDFAESEKIAVLATVEYRKMTNSIKHVEDITNSMLNEAIKETKTLEYRANWIGHILNDLHMNPDDSSLYVYDPEIPMNERNNENKSPIVLLRITKNKITSMKTTIPYIFLHERATQVEVSNNHLKFLSPESVEIIGKYVTNEYTNISYEPNSGKFNFVKNTIRE